MKFDYYYGKEADQFTFIRIPKLLLTHEAFSELSIQAKVLFGILLDRMSLSMRNGWLDEEKRVYIIYQIQEIQKDLGFSKKKSMDYLNELEKIGLVEKKRRGLGLPSILYVKSFLSGVEDEHKEEECSDENANSIENGTSRSVDLGTSRSTDLGTSRGAEIALQEVPAEGPLKNNTNIINTYWSDIESNQSNLITSGENDSKLAECIVADQDQIGCLRPLLAQIIRMRKAK